MNKDKEYLDWLEQRYICEELVKAFQTLLWPWWKKTLYKFTRCGKCLYKNIRGEK